MQDRTWEDFEVEVGGVRMQPVENFRARVISNPGRRELARECKGVCLHVINDGLRREYIAAYFAENGVRYVLEPATETQPAIFGRFGLRPKHYPPKKGRKARRAL